MRTFRTPFSFGRLLNASLLVFGGCLVGFLAGEAVLRTLGYEGEEERAQVTIDPKYRHVDEESWIHEFDPNGANRSIRGREIPARDPREIRVLFVGDSATEGMHVALEETFPLRFEALANESSSELRVRSINAGASGMSTIDEYHLFTEKLLPLEPDVVVLGFFLANDINFNLRYSELGLEEHRVARWLAALRRRSALAHLLYLKALAAGGRWGDHASRRDWKFLPPELRFTEDGLSLLSYPDGELLTYRGTSPYLEHAYDLLRETLARFRALSSEHGFRFVVLLIPTPATVTGDLIIGNYPNHVENLRKKGIRLSAAELDLELPTKRVLAICDELEIFRIDATDQMRRLGLSAFVPGDEHPSGEGHDCLARALLDADILAPRVEP